MAEPLRRPELIGRRYHANPSQHPTEGDDDVRPWLVWDLDAGLDGSGQPRKILYVGTMEEAGSVADALEARRWQKATDG